jgi:CRP/FNR family cyclic AMP-dependent transcriptional regulator
MERRQDCMECVARGQHVFCNMDIASLRELTGISTRVQYGSGAVIFREADSCESAYVLCSGRVKISTTSRDGRTLILKIARAGELIGLSAVLGNLAYEITAETIEPCQLTIIRRQALLEFLNHHPDASMTVARAIAQEYKAAFCELRRLALPATAAGRVASLLLDWSREQVPKTALRPRFIMTFTHEEIGAMTATTRETVTRILIQMRREQIIKINGAALTVLQPDALERLAV